MSLAQRSVEAVLGALTGYLSTVTSLVLGLKMRVRNAAGEHMLSRSFLT